MFGPIETAIEDIRRGNLIILVDDESRENEGDFCIAAEHAKAEHINFMTIYGRGLVCMSVTQGRANELRLPLMTETNTEFAGCKFTVSVDARVGTTTGISADDRARTIQTLIGEQTKPDDLRRPGHLFPLLAEDGGVLVRPGHTEASIDLCRLGGLYPAGVICEILNEDGSMARRNELFAIATRHGLGMYAINDLVHLRKRNSAWFSHIIS